jgi:hypothetical protein
MVDLLSYRRRASEPTTFERARGYRPARRSDQSETSRVVHAARPFDRTANARANPNRSYSYSTVSESLVIEYGPDIFEHLRRPRPGQRFSDN